MATHYSPASPAPQMPGTILGPLLLFVLGAVACAAMMVLSLVDVEPSALRALAGAGGAIACSWAAVGLWARWQSGRVVGIALAVLLVPTGIGLLVTVAVVWALLTTSANWWLRLPARR
ncbi:hypothetical protein [Polymorphospora rubra]|uniref:Uncharacterized protein n=1 Tax=Polymorphospora rubra TaxID=338584 RepID=A0A810MVB2_9ACTN|nr:hypothetical protein [Polymorphospora rubra]BCJ65126.1 hypothetical protein Prubr_21470 [Polymorphospora rubra]